MRVAKTATSASVPASKRSFGRDPGGETGIVSSSSLLPELMEPPRPPSIQRDIVVLFYDRARQVRQDGIIVGPPHKLSTRAASHASKDRL